MPPVFDWWFLTLAMFIYIMKHNKIFGWIEIVLSILVFYFGVISLILTDFDTAMPIGDLLNGRGNIGNLVNSIIVISIAIGIVFILQGILNIKNDKQIT